MRSSSEEGTLKSFSCRLPETGFGLEEASGAEAEEAFAGSSLGSESSRDLERFGRVLRIAGPVSKEKSYLIRQ